MSGKIVTNVKIFLDKCQKDKISAYAAQTSYFIILSAIPFLMLFFSLIQYTSVTEDVILEIAETLTPDYLSPFLLSIIDEVYNRSMGIISVSAIAAIWSASTGIHYMADGLNSVNDIEETRNWFVLHAWAIVYMAVFLIAIVLSLLVLIFGNSLSDFITQYFPVLEYVTSFVHQFKGIGMYAVLTFFFCIVFKALPNRKLTLRSQLPGALICSAAWYIFSFFVSIYVNYFDGFSMYGSLTTIVMVMLWLYFCMYIMMLSAEINVVFEAHFKKARERRESRKNNLSKK